MPIPPDTHERYDLDEPAPLRISVDDQPDVTVVEIGVTRIDITPQVTVFAGIDADAFGSLRTAGTFGLDGTAEPPDWEPDQPIELTLRLDDETSLRFDDGEVLVQTLFGTEETDLRVSGSWRALEAMQHVAVPGLDDETTSFGVVVER